jgi:hypothetical protein
MTLVLGFAGWCLLRLATDPDPSDEPRGVSGYTFAFAGEPDLDRILYVQPPPEAVFVARSQSPPIGVRVRAAKWVDTGRIVPELVGATVDLLEAPKLENRQGALTESGYEPIVPFHLRIESDRLAIDRTSPLNPADPTRPVWQAASSDLARQGASGFAFEPDTVGAATGIWDSVADRQARFDALTAELEKLGADSESVAATALRGRLAELRIGLDKPSDRRVTSRYHVERFSFPMVGPATVSGDQDGVLGATLDTEAAWPVSFWIGAWDPDVLCAFVEGSLQIPPVTAAPADG